MDWSRLSRRELLEQREGWWLRQWWPVQNQSWAASVQWLREIEVVDRDYQGYYQQKGWTEDAIMKTATWIDVPVHGSTLGADSTLCMEWPMRHLRGAAGRIELR